MEFSPADHNKYRDLLLQTYKTFAKFCSDNDIHYFETSAKEGKNIDWGNKASWFYPLG